jgi:hypothetical protein
MLVHLSGGDITGVRTPAGSGLAGGTENGTATLSLGAGQSQPQTCSNDQVPKWNGSGWSCGHDNDTTYGNGTGLDLIGTTFSVSPSYRLPQNCASGQVAKSAGSNGWSCQSLASVSETSKDRAPWLRERTRRSRSLRFLRETTSWWPAAPCGTVTTTRCGSATCAWGTPPGRSSTGGDHRERFPLRSGNAATGLRSLRRRRGPSQWRASAG